MSSNKGGGNRTTNEYHGTIAGVVGEGPAASLCWIIMGGKVVFDPAGGFLDRPAGADYSDIDLVDVGKARWYWGTDTQVADPELTKYDEQPGYRGQVYLVLIDCSWGSNGETNTPTIEIGWRRPTGQLVITGSPTAIDGNATANPMTVAAEILTSWNWGNLPLSRLNAATFQAVANSLGTEGVAGTNRIASSVAPLWNEQIDLRSALADLSSISKAWLRVGTDGRIEAGRWLRSGTPSATALTNDDCDSVSFTVQDTNELSNSFLVEFRDSTKHHKTNCITRDNIAETRRPGAILRRTTASRPMLTTQEQAIAHASDLLRDQAQPLRSVKLAVRRHKAVNPDGSPIRPGDYFMFDIAEQGDAADVRLFRCVRREFEPTGPITLTGELETNGSLHYVPPVAAPTVVAEVVPPINWARVLAIAPLVTDDRPCVTVFAARPSDTAFSFDVQYCKTSTGDFASVGSTSAFALPLNLGASFASTATTLRVQMVTGASGANARRDQSMLLNWNGGVGEGGADALLICVIQKDGSNNVTGYEFVSVAGPVTSVSTDVYDVPVLRGRRGTTARDFTAGTFPDSTWTQYELWCIPLDGLGIYDHADFETDITSQAAMYFELIASGLAGTYDPASAYAEKQRRTTAGIAVGEYGAQPDGTTVVASRTYTMPSTRIPPVYSNVNGFVSVVFIRSATQPATPTGGSYASPVPAGWSNTTPTGTNPVWMSVRRFTPTGVGQDAAWSTPVKMQATDGQPGPGLTYVGAFSASTIYYCTSSRVDVVSVGSNYYRATNTAKSGTATWSDPTAVGQTDWSAPDATFKFTATDLALLRDATIIRTLVMGDGSTGSGGIIRSAGATSFSAGDGFWMNPRNASNNTEVRFGKAGGNRLEFDGTQINLYTDYAELGSSYGTKLIVDKDPTSTGPAYFARVRFGTVSLLATSSGDVTAYFGATNVTQPWNNSGPSLRVGQNRNSGSGGSPTLLFTNDYWSPDLFHSMAGMALLKGVDTGSGGGKLQIGTTANGSGTNGQPTVHYQVDQNGDFLDASGNRLLKNARYTGSVTDAASIIACLQYYGLCT